MFENIIGLDLRTKPQIVHKNIPKKDKRYILKDKSLVEESLIILETCGKKAIVVQKAAKKPT